MAVPMRSSNFGAGIVGPVGVHTPRALRPMGARPRIPMVFRRGFAAGGSSPWDPAPFSPTSSTVSPGAVTFNPPSFNPGAVMSMMRAGMPRRMADGGQPNPVAPMSPAMLQIMQTLQRMRMNQPHQLDAAYQSARQASPYIAYNPKYGTQFLQKQLQQQQTAPTQAAIQGTGAMGMAAQSSPMNIGAPQTAGSAQSAPSASSYMPSTMGYAHGGRARYDDGGIVDDGSSYDAATVLPTMMLPASEPTPQGGGNIVMGTDQYPLLQSMTDPYYTPGGALSTAAIDPNLRASISSDQANNRGGLSSDLGKESDPAGHLNWMGRNAGWVLPALLAAGMLFSKKGGQANPAQVRAMSQPPGWNNALPKSTFLRQANPSPLPGISDYYTYGSRPEVNFFNNSRAPVPAARGGHPQDGEGPSMGVLAQASRHIKGPGGGQEDAIPADLSDGEYVFDSSTVSDIGDGSNDEGARRLDRMRDIIAKDKGRKHRVPPKAKSVEHYVRASRRRAK